MIPAELHETVKQYFIRTDGFVFGSDSPPRVTSKFDPTTYKPFTNENPGNKKSSIKAKGYKLVDKNISENISPERNIRY